jgi:hypothetical protein
MTVIAALALVVLVAACGGGTFFISFHSGTIAGSPICRTDGGQFDLRQPGGVLVLVVLTNDSTIILAGGARGACGDLRANTPVTVQGPLHGSRITAQTVAVQSSTRA